MAIGPGKYDKLASWVRERAKAQGVILAVFGGEKGNGFEIQLPASIPVEGLRTIASALRHIADEVERDASRIDRPAAKG